jgi:uncharacterized membrane protein
VLASARNRAGTSGAVLRLALLAGGLLWVNAAAADSAPATARTHRAPRHVTGARLEGRVGMLSRGLDLDPAQRAELRKVLEDEREQIQRVWNDPSRSGADRVGATKAIGERTGDRIRSLLNEEQRKKYNPPRPPREPVASSDDGQGVEYWMRLSRPRQGEKAEPHVDLR